MKCASTIWSYLTGEKVVTEEVLWLDAGKDEGRMLRSRWAGRYRGNLANNTADDLSAVGSYAGTESSSHAQASLGWASALNYVDY